MKLVREHMTDSDHPKPGTFSEIYLRLLNSLTNKRNMPNSIGRVEELAPIFFGFDHQKTLAVYSDWEDLFDAIKKYLKRKPRMEKENPHNYWVIFCKGSLSAARYLSRFSTPEEFLEFVDDFDANPNTRPALPFLIGHEIFGYGFALACDFLKEMGFANYSKPDQHLIDIFSGLGISDESQLDVFRTVTLFAEEVGETPYAVDKAFWLIGSGKLYKNNLTFETNKKEFVQQVKEGWAKEKEKRTNG
jgi:hypothetical protein